MRRRQAIKIVRNHAERKRRGATNRRAFRRYLRWCAKKWASRRDDWKGLRDAAARVRALPRIAPRG